MGHARLLLLTLCACGPGFEVGSALEGGAVDAVSATESSVADVASSDAGVDAIDPVDALSEDGSASSWITCNVTTNGWTYPVVCGAGWSRYYDALPNPLDASALSVVSNGVECDCFKGSCPLRCDPDSGLCGVVANVSFQLELTGHCSQGH